MKLNLPTFNNFTFYRVCVCVCRNQNNNIKYLYKKREGVKILIHINLCLAMYELLEYTQKGFHKSKNYYFFQALFCTLIS